MVGISHFIDVKVTPINYECDDIVDEIPKLMVEMIEDIWVTNSMNEWHGNACHLTIS